MRTDLPSGTVTFLFTDVEGSTRLLHELGREAYAEALAEHRAIVRSACARERGVEVDTQGDAFFFAFPTAAGALAAAAVMTENLAATQVRVRAGLHTGAPLQTDEGYVGHDVHRAARIASAAHGGQVVVSAATAALLDRDDLRDLGEHRFKDLAAPERVYQLGSLAFPPLKSLGHTNLPIPATPFTGRTDELGAVATLLADEPTRLLTLTGPGGTGKTRLALQAAAEVSDAFPEGVYWVPLAPLRDPALVLPSMAQALSVREQPGLSAVDALAESLNGSRMLIVLDNFEHLLGAAPELADLLARTTNLALLATSRETLRLQAEREYPVPPLASEEAVQLFCERSRMEPTATIRELCARLDNLPLALELAAARLKLLSPEQLLERLSQRLDILKGGRDADPRQQTLRATIEWSYDLLSREERALFARLSVFQGGATLEAVEAVCGAELDVLESLLDKSLLRRRDDGGAARFWMLETIREYAAERLGEAGEIAVLRAAHAECFLALAEVLEPPQLGGVDEAWVARAAAETDNFRAAIAHYAALPDPTSEIRIAGSLFRFWPSVGLVREGRAISDRALERSAGADPVLQMKALYAVSVCAFYQGDPDVARACELQRLALARRIGDRQTEIVASNDLALLALDAGDVDVAESMLEDGLALARELGDERLALSLSNNVAELAVRVGDYARSQDLLEEGLAVAARIGDTWAHAHVYETLGFTLLEAGEPAHAATRFAQGLALLSVVPLTGSYCLDGLAAAAAATGDYFRAARLAGVAEELRRTAGFLPGGFEQRYSERTERSARSSIGAEAWEAQKALGVSMSLDEAVAYALEALPDA